jgi:phosphotriesterase-related protein
MTDAPAASLHTVRGPVRPGDVGRILPHEHVFCDMYRVSRNLDHLLNDGLLAVDELGALRDIGGSAVVDCTPPDLGRDHQLLRRASEESGVHIIAATGWYRRAFYPAWIDETPTNALAERMIGELLEGIDGTDIRAGVIGEIGVDRDVLSGVEERVLRAAARAQRRTGAPIITHASMYPAGLAQLDILEEEGVDSARIVIGHADTYLDPDYHRAVLERGAYLAFDTIARVHQNPDERRAEAIVGLLDHGWGERLLLSSDRCFRSDLLAFGGPGYGVVITSFFERLRRAGVSDATLDLMTIDNPRRLFAW